MIERTNSPIIPPSRMASVAPIFSSTNLARRCLEIAGALVESYGGESGKRRVRLRKLADIYADTVPRDPNLPSWLQEYRFSPAYLIDEFVENSVNAIFEGSGFLRLTSPVVYPDLDGVEQDFCAYLQGKKIGRVTNLLLQEMALYGTCFGKDGSDLSDNMPIIEVIPNHAILAGNEGVGEGAAQLPIGYIGRFAVERPFASEYGIRKASGKPDDQISGGSSFSKSPKASKRRASVPDTTVGLSDDGPTVPVVVVYLDARDDSGKWRIAEAVCCLTSNPPSVLSLRFVPKVPIRSCQFHERLGRYGVGVVERELCLIDQISELTSQMLACARTLGFGVLLADEDSPGHAYLRESGGLAPGAVIPTTPGIPNEVRSLPIGGYPVGEVSQMIRYLSDAFEQRAGAAARNFPVFARTATAAAAYQDIQGRGSQMRLQRFVVDLWEPLLQAVLDKWLVRYAGGRFANGRVRVEANLSRQGAHRMAVAQSIERVMVNGDRIGELLGSDGKALDGASVVRSYLDALNLPGSSWIKAGGSNVVDESKSGVFGNGGLDLGDGNGVAASIDRGFVDEVAADRDEYFRFLQKQVNPLARKKHDGIDK